jgi:MerR family transcriptional regulator, copper efflux regulator
MTMTDPAGTWTVGRAAHAAGLSAKAVRLYEAKGLLPEAERTGAGYRAYTGDDITVLRFIRQAKTLGLSLAEIRDILDLRRGGTTPCRHVTALLDQRIRETDHAISELRKLRHALADTRTNARQHQASGHSDCVCGIIEHAHPAQPPRQHDAGE